MTTQPAPTCWIIAGPNGAGKTTFALTHFAEIADCKHFINADLIASGLNPLAPETRVRQAGRLFLTELERRIQARESFCFETTLAGRTYLRLVARLRAEAWRVELIYLALPSVEMSRLRVKERVDHGGHDIPIADIERRFPRSLRNLLNEYSYATDKAWCFMNSGNEPELIFIQEGEERTVIDTNLFNRLLESAEL